MEKYVEDLKEYLGERRNFTKTMFKMLGTAYRAVQSGRRTWDDIISLTEEESKCI